MLLYIDLKKGIGDDMKKKYPGGRWVTIRGRKVYILKTGEVAPEFKKKLEGMKWHGTRPQAQAITARGETRYDGGRSMESSSRRKNARTVRSRRNQRVEESRVQRQENRKSNSKLPITKFTEPIQKSSIQAIHSKTYSAVYHEVNDPKLFHTALKEAKVGNDYGAYVDLHTVEDYQNMRLFLAEDGASGVAITQDYDIVSVFKNPNLGAKRKNVGKELVALGVQMGGKTLDCFDGFLPNLYMRAGFKPMARVAFDREYAPKDWNYERDKEPDVVFMRYTGKPQGPYDPDKVPLVDYEEAERLQKADIVKAFRIITLKKGGDTA